MNFKVIRNSLTEKDEFGHILELENEQYQIKFHYLGEYLKEKKQSEIMPYNIHMICKPKGTNLDLILAMDDNDRTSLNIYVNGSTESLSFLDEKGILRLKEQLDIANEARIELCKYLEEYFLQYAR